MKNKFTFLFSVTILFLFISCNKKETRIDSYFVNLATVEKIEFSTTFKLDNGGTLTPKNTIELDIKNGDRVILNYTPKEDNYIIVNNIQKIFLDTLQTDNYPQNRDCDPIKLISIWVSGNYLNFSIQVDYHSIPHKIGLYRDMQAKIPTMYFSYSRGDDPPGAPTLSYLSFKLNNLEKGDFIVFINTYEGEREISLTKN